VNEPLGCEASEETLDNTLLQVKMDGLLVHGAGILKYDRVADKTLSLGQVGHQYRQLTCQGLLNQKKREQKGHDRY